MNRTPWHPAARAGSVAVRRARADLRRRVVAAWVAAGLTTAPEIAARLHLAGVEVHPNTVGRDLRALGVRPSGGAS